MSISDTNAGMNPLTLRFRDDDLEQAFQRDTAATDLHRARLGSWVGALLWLLGLVVGPAIVPVDRALLTVVGVSMIVMNGLFALPLRRPTTANRQQAFGLVGNLLSTAGLVVLLRSRPEFARHTGPALMLQSVFAFSFMGLRFIGAATAAVVYVAVIVVQTLAYSEHGASAVDAGFVAASVLVATGAAYLIERATRERFVQRRVIERQTLAIAAEREESDRLLRNILPDDIVARLRDDSTAIADAASDATRHRLDARFTCTQRPPITVKGKGEVATWLVTRRPEA